MPHKSSGSKKKSSARSSRSAGSQSSRSKTAASSKSSRRSSASNKVIAMPRRDDAGSARGTSSSSSRAAESRALTDHDEIRQWAEERGAHPACVRGTGGGDDVRMIRLDFPGYSGEQSLEGIDWDQWFDKFDESGLALLVQDRTAQGKKSNFNKLLKRETAEHKKSSRRTSRRGAA